MEEQKNQLNIEKGIYSPRRRRTSKINGKLITLLNGFGKRRESDKNALRFVDTELKKKKH